MMEIAIDSRATKRGQGEIAPSLDVQGASYYPVIQGLGGLINSTSSKFPKLSSRPWKFSARLASRGFVFLLAWSLSLNSLGGPADSTGFFKIRSMPIRSTKLKLGKNLEKFRNISGLSFKLLLEKALFLHDNFYRTRKKIETTSIACLTKPKHPFLASELPNLICHYYWKPKEFRKDLRLDFTAYWEKFRLKLGSLLLMKQPCNW